MSRVARARGLAVPAAMRARARESEMNLVKDMEKKEYDAEVKKRLLAARDAMQKKIADYETRMAEQGDRVLELEKIAVEAGKGDDIKKAAAVSEAVG